jgi:WD40 repeat protein
MQTVQLWEMATMRLRKEFIGHVGEVMALGFSPDGRFLATRGTDTTVLIWHARGNRKLHQSAPFLHVCRSSKSVSG